MNTSTLKGTRNHNAFLKNKKGVPERSVRILSKIPFWQVDRLKGEQIYHKYGCRNFPPVRSSVSITTFCGNISLTYKRGFPILTSNESKFLSKTYQTSSLQF